MKLTKLGLMSQLGLSAAFVGIMATTMATPVHAQSPEERQQAAQYEIIKNKLATSRIDIEYEEQPFADVIENLKQRSGLNIVVDSKALADNGQTPISINPLKQIPLGNGLAIILEKVKLKYTFRHGVLWVTTAEEAFKGVTVLHFYDVRDLTMHVKDFPGTKIKLKGGDDGGGSGPVFEDEAEKPEPVTTDELEKLLPEVTGDGKWGDNPEAGVIQVMGMLIVRQTPEVHAEIKAFLQQLRANR